MARGADWSAVENAACVRAYLDMLAAELRREPYVKKQVNRRLQETTGRTAGSIEFKFRNVSAVLRDLRYPYVQGYLPAANYQQPLVSEVERQLAERSALENLLYAWAVDPEPQPLRADLQLVDAPVIEFGLAAHTRRGIKRDYALLEELNRKVGLEGEHAVVDFERARLRRLGHDRLAERVEHVSQTRGDGLGFDVLSFETSGRERFIEVKTTRQGPHAPILVTSNEVSFSEVERDSYHLYRLFGLGGRREGLFTVPGALTEQWALAPVLYEGLPA